MSKEQIAQSYLEETKAKYLGHPAPVVHNVILVGSNNLDNIGAIIALRLLDDGYNVDEYDKETWTREHIRSDFSVLILANGSTHLNWIENQYHTDIDEVIDDCLTESIRSTNTFVQQTLDTPGAKYIIYIGSMAYRNVLNASSPYCAAKAGLAHFAKCMAWELAPKNYNVFCIHPSNTQGTPMTEQTIQGLMRYRNLDRQQAEQYWGASLPKEKWLQPEDIAEIVSLILQGRMDYMSGSQIEMAGGQR